MPDLKKVRDELKSLNIKSNMMILESIKNQLSVAPNGFGRRIFDSVFFVKQLKSSLTKYLRPTSLQRAQKVLGRKRLDLRSRSVRRNVSRQRHQTCQVSLQRYHERLG